MPKPSLPEPCPCDGPAPYAACCGRWHDGAEHPRTRPTTLAPPPPGLRWIGLEVRRHSPLDDDHATVEFVARSKLGGRADRMQMTSRFERVEGRWLYVDDDAAL